MLQQRCRLRHAVDLERVRVHGRSWRHPLLILLVLANDQECSRFAFIASRRVGNAVARNRTKRLLREIIRLHLDEIETSWDCLFISRGRAAGASYVDLEAAVLQILSRAELLVKNGMTE